MLGLRDPAAIMLCGWIKSATPVGRNEGDARARRLPLPLGYSRKSHEGREGGTDDDVNRFRHANNPFADPSKIEHAYAIEESVKNVGSSDAPMPPPCPAKLDDVDGPHTRARLWSLMRQSGRWMNELGSSSLRLGILKLSMYEDTLS